MIIYHITIVYYMNNKYRLKAKKKRKEMNDQEKIEMNDQEKI